MVDSVVKQAEQLLNGDFAWATFDVDAIQQAERCLSEGRGPRDTTRFLVNTGFVTTTAEAETIVRTIEEIREKEAWERIRLNTFVSLMLSGIGVALFLRSGAPLFNAAYLAFVTITMLRLRW